MILLGYLLLQTIATIFVVIILFGLIALDVFCSRRHSITEIAHLDIDEWIVQLDQAPHHMYLLNSCVWGSVAILRFKDKNSEKIFSIYIAKDQLNLKAWKILKKMIKLSP